MPNWEVFFTNNLYLLAKKLFYPDILQILFVAPIWEYFCCRYQFCKYVLLLSQPSSRIYFVATTNFGNICCCHYQISRIFLVAQTNFKNLFVASTNFANIFVATPNWEVLDARGRNYEAAVSLTQLSVFSFL